MTKTAQRKNPGKWRIISDDAKARTIIMQRGREIARFEMGSMRRISTQSAA